MSCRLEIDTRQWIPLICPITCTCCPMNVLSVSLLPACFFLLLYSYAFVSLFIFLSIGFSPSVYAYCTYISIYLSAFSLSYLLNNKLSYIFLHPSLYRNSKTTTFVNTLSAKYDPRSTLTSKRLLPLSPLC